MGEQTPKVGSALRASPTTQAPVAPASLKSLPPTPLCKGGEDLTTSTHPARMLQLKLLRRMDSARSRTISWDSPRWLEYGMRMTVALLFSLVFRLVAAGQGGSGRSDLSELASQPRSLPMGEETRQFIVRLARFVRDHHLKRDPASAQAGMVYEYRDMAAKRAEDRFVQGEALDTMHDGAWLAAALVRGYRATGDPLLLELLTRWQLPFYTKVLNHSDELFSARVNHARPDRQKVWSNSKVWLFQEGEKGFCPYWWDDGFSVSLERNQRSPLPPFPCFDHFADAKKANPGFRLNGYSLGCSNHMAQDLAVMLQVAWLFLRSDGRETYRRQAAVVAEAAENLHRSRVRHHGPIPMCLSAAAIAKGDVDLMRRVPDPRSLSIGEPRNEYYRGLYAYEPGKRVPVPGFADDAEYQYYFGIAKLGGELSRALAFRLVYDALTIPLLYRYYSDDEPAPPGLHRFDLHPTYLRDGRPVDYRSDRKGPGGGPRPVGSRLGPQNMVVCGLALQALRSLPGLWEERYRRDFRSDLRVYIHDKAVEPGAENRKTRCVLADMPLDLWSTRTAFCIASRAMKVPAESTPVILRIFSRGDGQGQRADVKVFPNRVEVRNSDGRPLRARSHAQASPQGVAFRLELPYTVVKGQAAWANGVEHGRYTVDINGQRRNIYLASSEGDVRRALERELAGGLRTWKTIFEQWGYIPTGIGGGRAGGGGRWKWENFSDSGGYAHLISAASQWVFYLERRRDWHEHRVPTVGQAAKEANRTCWGTIAEIPPETAAARRRRIDLVRKRRAYTPVLVHRGAHRFSPENTLEAYATAMDRGADGVEIDIRRSRDGILYLFHDDTLDRTTRGKGKVREKTYFELASCGLKGAAKDRKAPCIPTLAAALTLARDRAMLLHLDVKEPGLQDEIFRLIEQAELWEHLVEVNTGNAERIRHHPKVKLLQYKGWFPQDAVKKDPRAAERFLARPGNMVFCKWDPAGPVKALGRNVRKPVPVPGALRHAWKANGPLPPFSLRGE